MAHGQLEGVIRHLRRVSTVAPAEELSNAQLL